MIVRLVRNFGWIACLSALLAACGGGSQGPLSQLAQLGELAFNDPILSASGRQSCASCHAAESGHAAPNALPVQAGGADGMLPGLRNSQTLRYLAGNGAFRLNVAGDPLGGFFWDGRANTLAEQAAGPLLGAREMANADKAAVVARISAATWSGRFQRMFGDDVLNDVDRAFEKLTVALAQFQLEDTQFNAFTSKYDAVLRGQARLSPSEQHGLELFNDPTKGNCAACHPSEREPDGRHPLFTDFSYDNLGVPRNPEIPANADPAYFDLGLCARQDLQDRRDLCGAFKVPTLRNVTLRKVYFHNGRFRSLRDVLDFYVQRETHPEKWYSKNPDGSVRKYDDLPAAFHGNVNTEEGPYDRKPGMSPAMSPAEIDDLLTFLSTLTDGWGPR